MRYSTGLIVAAAIATPSLAEAEERAPRVAIVSAVSVNVTPEESTRLASELGAVLGKELVVDAIAGEEANRRLPDGKVPEGCVAEAECIADVGSRLDADQVLFLAVVRLGDRLQIDPTWADPTSGRTVSREAIVIEGDQAREQVFAAAAQGLLPDAAKRTSPVNVLQSEQRAPIVVNAVEAPEPRGREITRGVLIAGGVGAAALIGAVSFSVAAKSADNRLQRNGCDQQPCDPALVDSLERRALAADLLYGAAAASAVTAGVLYFLSDNHTGGAEVQASAMPGGAGIVVKGQF